ncbi:hypothetical protein GLAREA_07676 [Glarea lozoyensis ATCC 20868]|uniref:Uncharacterized protein n=1 Tax=Glarea lozoyensis (strain ATCC 20868 / MF5171) TaxID=1116229 RepID=S3D1V5_GLAL2|nr:uncharacterized protein GLAREA_07676 [Glarea lozoyensis ATCC 20868]EPE32542.1 hypothetical protein GLAREA_07676 [Glarea lozoyensis ATCC 20868]
MARLTQLFFLLALILTVLASSPPSFCKCTCFTNSTIIPLSSSNSQSSHTEPRSQSTSCSACKKSFCLEQRLPICKDAEEKDVFTMCFQRDSRKDQIVVLSFIAGTVGLLGWAAVRKVLERRKRGGEGEGYTAVGR